MPKILFVCMGNICRSPTAEAVFTQKVQEAGLASQIGIDSCGTGGWHAGKPPDTRAQAAASNRGYAMSHLRARRVRVEDFSEFDLVVAMDYSNRHELLGICPLEARDRIHLFLDFAEGVGEREVPDPYFGGEKGFELVLDLVENAADGLLAHLRREHGF